MKSDLWPFQLSRIPWWQYSDLRKNRSQKSAISSSAKALLFQPMLACNPVRSGTWAEPVVVNVVCSILRGSVATGPPVVVN